MLTEGLLSQTPQQFQHSISTCSAIFQFSVVLSIKYNAVMEHTDLIQIPEMILYVMNPQELVEVSSNLKRSSEL